MACLSAVHENTVTVNDAVHKLTLIAKGVLCSWATPYIKKVSSKVHLDLWVPVVLMILPIIHKLLCYLVLHYYALEKYTDMGLICTVYAVQLMLRFLIVPEVAIVTCTNIWRLLEGECIENTRKYFKCK